MKLCIFLKSVLNRPVISVAEMSLVYTCRVLNMVPFVLIINTLHLMRQILQTMRCSTITLPNTRNFLSSVGSASMRSSHTLKFEENVHQKFRKFEEDVTSFLVFTQYWMSFRFRLLRALQAFSLFRDKNA